MSGSILKKQDKRNGYGCPVPYCREKQGSWWLCSCCGSDVCKTHEVFNGRTVSYCAICCPQKFGLIDDMILENIPTLATRCNP